MPITQPIASTALMKRSTGATFHNWLLACDRHLASMTQQLIMGTYSLAVSGWTWCQDFEMDLLPSEAATRALASLRGETGGLA